MIEHESTQCVQFISEILGVLKSTNQYQKVLHLVVDRITRLYKCQTCAVVVIDPKSEYLRVENSSGLSLTFCNSFRNRLATGAIGQLLWTGKQVLIPDSEDTPLLAKEVMLEYSFGSSACVPMTVDHRSIGYLHVDSKEKRAFVESDLHILQSFADFSALAIFKSSLYDENMKLDRIDHETNLEKFSSFLERFDASLERAKDFNEHFAVLLLDVDNFKDIVHLYGYDTSKLFLKELGAIVRSQLRPVDAGGRYGFDEMIIMLAHTQVDEAVTKAYQLCKIVQATNYTSYKFSSTVSIGVAGYPESGRSKEELLRSAKEALFEAQREGRNKIHFHELQLSVHTAQIL